METKPALQTTEFWTMVFTMLISLLNEVGIWDYTSNGASAYIMAIVGGLYAVSRGLAKLNVKPTE